MHSARDQSRTRHPPLGMWEYYPCDHNRHRGVADMPPKLNLAECGAHCATSHLPTCPFEIDYAVDEDEAAALSPSRPSHRRCRGGGNAHSSTKTRRTWSCPPGQFWRVANPSPRGCGRAPSGRGRGGETRGTFAGNKIDRAACRKSEHWDVQATILLRQPKRWLYMVDIDG